MTNRPEQPERVVAVDHKAHIANTIHQAKSTLAEFASRFRGDFLLHVNAPEIPIHSPKEYKEIMGRELDLIGIGLLGMRGEMTVEPQMGLLIVRGIGTDELHFGFCAQRGGQDFEVRVTGNKVEVSGTNDLKSVDEALSLIFTPDGKYSQDRKQVHVTTISISSLPYFDSRGNPLPEKH